MTNKRLVIKVRYIIAFFVIICGISFATNIYLTKKYPEAFEKEENQTDDRKSQLITSDDNNYKYKIGNDNTVEIVAYLRKDVEDVIVPNKINGLEVSTIGEAAFAYHDEIKSIKIPDTILNLEMAVWAGCINLEKIYFVGDVVNIDEYAFIEYTGCIVTKENTKLYEYAKTHNINVEI